MKLAELSVRRGVTFAMIFVVVLGFGLYSLSRLRLDLYPDVAFPTVLVVTTYTGASPEDMETLVSRPLEGAVAGVAGAEKVESESRQGVSVLTVAFEWGADMEQAETDVRRKLEQVSGLLPDDASDPLVFAMDPSLQPVLIVALSGPQPLQELRRLADDEVRSRLERLDGVATADVAGGLQREIRVALDPVRVAALGLDVDAVLGAIHQENLQEPGGSIEQGPLDFTIQAQGRYGSVAELRQVQVGVRQGASGPRVLRLGDVATVEDTVAEQRRILEVDGRPAVLVTVRKQSGANTVQAAEAVRAELERIQGEQAGQLGFQVVFDQARFIEDSLSNLSTTALLGVGISFLVLLLFLRDWRAALLVSAAIPLSVVATFFVMDQAGMTLNIISMAGLALAVGMLVDNAIVVLENIFRLREQGLPLQEAAIQGAAEVGTAVTASTLTTISVFIPVLFVSGIAGVLFRDMAITICFALVVSLLVALSFVPLAASRLLRSRGAPVPPEGDSPVAAGRGSAARAAPAGALGRLGDAYSRILGWSLRHRWTVACGVIGVLALTGLLAASLPTDFMAQADQSQLLLTVEAPVGSKTAETHALASEAIAALQETIPAGERQLVSLDLGTAEGFFAVFSGGAHKAQLRVPLVGVSHRSRSQAEYEAALRARVARIPGLSVHSGGHLNALGQEGDVVVEVRGHDLQTARRVGAELKQQLESLPDVAGVSFSLQDQKPQVSVRFDRNKMAELGLSTAKVGRALSTAFMGRVAGSYSEDGEEYSIRVRYGEQHRLDVDALRRMPVVTPTGRTVPLHSIAEVTDGLGPVDISRRNQERVTRLVVTLQPRYQDSAGAWQDKDLGGSAAGIQALLGDYEWPQGFRPTVSGAAEDLRESFASLGLALLVSVLLVYMVMAAQFESLRQPFIILCTVPLAGVGVVGAFLVTGSAVDVSALIGVIMLVGIVVNNGIVMIDAANRLRQEGLDRAAAISEAARLRLRPVLLTSLTTILSMVPLALELGEGAETWAGMARAVIGGLSAATVLTLVVVPVAYSALARKHEAPAPALEPQGSSPSLKPSEVPA